MSSNFSLSVTTACSSVFIFFILPVSIVSPPQYELSTLIIHLKMTSFKSWQILKSSS